ncbi:hypothetical protein LWP59_10865 [Amycolatopsis acidiphila]|uniref:Uncharacterized protein n=1 Tax=Amycolatopsis acidiphila TaxID=715473 RepID=A0A557ZS47_9PSEU|nr:hypothetical protein [Amycolatopsis acidiphila]TVT14821.1 hypothetical protein FNH06_37110 [Amycolatopsis acidiphila]UIJ62082.1 hypothetical protein LWP59_10865 [Amycolatopsis acidiphila]GHG91781.1 hypothetical protein GCM10017788_68090 [Amycolatopsis acidiphila]
MVAPQYPPARGDTAPLPRIPAAPGRSGGPLLKALGLVAVAVVAGLVWWLVRHDAGDTAVAQPPAKEFAFTAAEGPVASTDCASKSTDEVKKWFGTHQCQALSRALYTTTAGGSTALVSVALVTMPTADEAQQLKALADRDGTGNVSDLVRDGTAKISGAPKLADGAYSSRANANRVTIVLSAFFDGHADKATLSRVNAEALDLSAQFG